jgi:hypothetical protein
VAHLFPNLSPAELSQAQQVATAAAERKAARKHRWPIGMPSTM